MMKTRDLRRAFTWLESGSVLLVSTHDGTRKNVMTISWQMVMDFTPRIAISTGSWNESFQTILDQKECCLCVPSFDMLDTVVEIGTVHASEGDKFDRFNLPWKPGKKTDAPLITSCLAAVECRLEDYIEDHGLLILHGIQLWENDHPKDTRVIHANGDGTFFADGEFRNLREKMRVWVPAGSERL